MSSGDFVTQALTVVSSTPGIHPDSTQASLMIIGFSGAAFTVSGVFAGTVSFYATADGGTNWSPINVAPSNNVTPVTSATAPGLFRANVSGYTHVSAQLSALTSGTPTVSIHCSSDAASSLSAGGTSGGGGGPGTGTGITTFTTTGTAGPSAWNAGTGALNIPVYASGAFNLQQITTATNVATASTSPVSSGVGVAFQAASNTNTLTLYSFTLSSTGASAALYMYLLRTTGAIPANGTAPGGTDVYVITNRQWAPPAASAIFNVTGSVYDTGLTVGTPYNYYIGYQSSGSYSLTLRSPSTLQVTEAK